MIKPKNELDLLREQLQGAQYDLLAYSKHAGESPVIDANIRHKRAQVEDLERRVLALEDEEKKLHGEQMSMLGRATYGQV